MYGLMIFCGVVGFISARSIEKKYGRAAWGWPAWVWGLICLPGLLIGGILQLIAVQELKRTPSVPAYGGGAVPIPVQPMQVMPTVPVQTTVPAGWHPDPSGRHQHRWWDGTAWTPHVSTNGVATVE